MYHLSFLKTFFLMMSLSIATWMWPIHAQITLDGSLGPSGALSGPNYMIEAEFGQSAGDNLFHSFGEFNLNTGESATFTGPTHIANIIGRVTGGNPSFIEGALNSKIPNADLYLLNPNGVLMGENASLNINGSFYFSSADYLRFADGQRFDTHFSMSPILSVAAPQSFGFLDQNIGSIVIENNELSVPAGKNLSIVGGDIRITNSILYSEGGHIQIASANSAGEVARADVMNNTLSQQGNIVIEGSNIINVGNPSFSQDNAVTISGGQIWLIPHLDEQRRLIPSNILGYNSTGAIQIASRGQLQIQNSLLQTQNTQGQASNFIFTAQQMLIENSSISSTTQDGQAGTIHVQTNELLTIYGTPLMPFISGFSTNTVGKGNGGHITVETQELSIMGNAGIVAKTEATATGNAGDITLNVSHLYFQEGGRVNASSAGSGDGGHITVNVTDSATIVGQSEPLPDGRIQPSGIGSSAFGRGHGGTIRMTVGNQLNLEKRGTLQTLTQGAGKAGDIVLNVQDLKITDGADIDASNEGTGQEKGGNITIEATGTVFITAEPGADETMPVVKEGFFGGIYSIAGKNAGMGGDVTLSARELIMRDGGAISVGSQGLGHAGHLKLSINDNLSMNNAAMITRATQAGGGNIEIRKPDEIRLINSEITAEARGTRTQDNGGNLIIDNVGLFSLDNSQLLANAYAGNGGEIQISTPQLKVFGDSHLNVSSELGFNGEFILNSIKLREDFMTLPPPKFQGADFSLDRCAGLSKDTLSQFLIINRDILPPSPEDLKTHYYFPE